MSLGDEVAALKAERDALQQHLQLEVRDARSQAFINGTERDELRAELARLRAVVQQVRDEIERAQQYGFPPRSTRWIAMLDRGGN